MCDVVYVVTRNIAPTQKKTVMRMSWYSTMLSYAHAADSMLRLIGRDCIVQNYWRTGIGRAAACLSSAFLPSGERMEYDVIDARYVSGFTIWLQFRDGRSGEVDLTHALDGPVFEPLHDLAFFQQFRVHPEWETLVWPNGADMAPEFLYEHVRVAA